MVTWPEYSMFVTQENDEEEKEGDERYVNKSGRNKGIAVHANFSFTS